MEAGDHYNPMFLKIKENAKRKTTHPGAAVAPVYNGELRWVFRDCLNCAFNRERETLP